jgi:predicted anti-sigma-YlaC factor YlaD
MAEPPTHITCIEVVELVSDYLEGALSPEEAELFEQHLNFCEGCESYVHQMRIALSAVGRTGEEAVPAEMRERLLAAFRDWRRP